MWKHTYFIVIILLYAVQGQSIEGLSVHLNGGLIKGLRAADGNYSMFLGIPYAKVDKYNPFGRSVPYIIQDVFEAYDDSVICPQVNPENNTIISVDCLRLNVFVPTPDTSFDTLLPVMLWIHGGSFQVGSGNRYLYNPSYLIQHDVIIVAINYRVGAYGFMCLDKPEVSGNQGLKDQYLAFKWVKENIKAFGGDPNQITVFGLSAGAHSIDFHLRSNKKPLFNKVILQSGSAEALTVLYSPDKQAPIKIAKYLGFKSDDIEETLSYLSKTDTNAVVAAATELNIQFKPCIESTMDSTDPFITSPWINSKIPIIKNIPVLMGFTKLEKAELSSRDDKSFENWNIVNDSLSQLFDFDKANMETEALVSRFYFGDNKISSNVKWGAIRFASDFTYIHPVHRTLMKYLDNGAKEVYLYMFSYVGGRNSVQVTDYDEFKSTGKLCCASHADDMAYLFNMQNKPSLTEADEIIMKRLTTMWTNFAKYSNPTPAVSELLPVIWKPYTINDYNYLNIDSDFVIGKQPLHDRMAFWDLFYTYNNISHKVYSQN